MKKSILFTLLFSTATVYAESSFLYSNRNRLEEKKVIFTESPIQLPDVPDTQQGDWFSLYVSPTFTGQARILLSSIQIIDDGSIRYIINNQSAKGFDNVSIEGMLCNGSLFDSEDAKVKVFAYADTVNNRWIETKQSNWKDFRDSRNNTDQVRDVIYDSLCKDINNRNDVSELRQRIEQNAGQNRLR